ncbi:MAG: hypothetical protein ACI4V4_01765 [Eubacterium sp.]
MKKNIPLLLAMIISLSTLLAAVPAFSAETVPTLKSISFENAEIDGTFSSDVTGYTVTLADNSKTPELKSYDIEGDGELLVTYSYDESGTQTGIVATLDFENGSMIYTFAYSNPVTAPISSDNFLKDIYCNCGEISPAVNNEEQKYTLYIPKDLTELTITPVTSDTNATCPPLKLSLTEEQTPEITLKCTASDGSERDYFVRIERVDKTTEQVKKEMSQEGYTTFVEETRVYENPEFLVAAVCVAIGLLVIIILRKVIIRIAANPYDKNEKPFYKENK